MPVLLHFELFVILGQYQQKIIFNKSLFFLPSLVLLFLNVAVEPSQPQTCIKYGLSRGGAINW